MRYRFHITFALLGSILASTSYVHAEIKKQDKQFYLLANGGYAFKSGSQSRNWIGNFVSPNVSRVKFSLGNGWNTGLTVGTKMRENLCLEFAVSYLQGAATVGKYGGGSFSLERSFSANMWRLMPSLVMSAGFDKFDPFIKTGMVLAFGTINYDHKAISGYDVTESKYLYKGGYGLGWTASLGLNYKMNDRLHFFSELQIINLSYSPDQSTLVKYTQNGQDKIDQVSMKARETYYVESYILKDQHLPYEEPAIMLRDRFALGSAGINLGVKINF